MLKRIQKKPETEFGKGLRKRYLAVLSGTQRYSAVLCSTGRLGVAQDFKGRQSALKGVQGARIA